MSRISKRAGTKAERRKAANGATKHAKRKAIRQITGRRRGRHIESTVIVLPADADIEPATNVRVVDQGTAPRPCPTCGETNPLNPCQTKSGNPCKDHAGRVR